MSETAQEAARDPRRPWQIAVAVLAVVTLTMLIINLVLRSRADQAVTTRDEAVAAVEQLRSENAELATRNEQLLTQLSASNERLADIVARVDGGGAADANVSRQVAAQKAAERAAARRGAGPREQVAVLRAQLRNAQTCAAGALQALAQVHAGPDIDSGSSEAAATLEAVLPACRAGLA
jgi:septal ring factor EnvC (AmiA/AmiB activator)